MANRGGPGPPRQRYSRSTRIFYILALLVVISMVLSLFVPVLLAPR